jgi:O-antigen ligase
VAGLAVSLALVAWIGGGAPWTLADALAAMLAIALLGSCAHAALRGAWPAWGRFEWCAVAGFVAVAAWQLLPLPPSAWLALPGRGSVGADWTAAGIAPGWHALSIDPDGSLRALLAALPALALALVARGAPARWRAIAAGLLVTVATASALLGLAQVAGGQGAWRPYAFHNLTGANGLFSYRNAHADFLLLAVPLAVAGVSSATARMPLRLASIASLACLLPALAATQSRAAWLLGPLAVVGGLALALSLRQPRDPREVPRRDPRRVAACLFACAVVLAVAWLAFAASAGGRIERAHETWSDPGRAQLAADVAVVARDYWPAGAGLGSFEQAFAHSDRNLALVGAYYHQAHDDWLQLVLEGGLAAVVLMLLGIGAYARATWRAWRSGGPGQGALARASSLSLALVMLHAGFDYGLHSGANLAAAGLLAGILAAVPRRRA